jgi:hypothetical protein
MFWAQIPLWFFLASLINWIFIERYCWDGFGQWKFKMWKVRNKICEAAKSPPLWSSGHSFWLQIQMFWVRFPALPDFQRSSGSGTGSTQPREDNWGATWREKYRLRSRKPRLTTGGIRCTDRATSSIRKSWYYANKRRSIGRYISLADQSHGV